MANSSQSTFGNFNDKVIGNDHVSRSPNTFKVNQSLLPLPTLHFTTPLFPSTNLEKQLPHMQISSIFLIAMDLQWRTEQYSVEKASEFINPLFPCLIFSHCAYFPPNHHFEKAKCILSTTQRHPTVLVIIINAGITNLFSP
jgi:hypothetical protein